MTKGIKHKDIGPELTRTEFEADDSHELEGGTSFPGSPVEKDRFYRTDEHKWYLYNGTAWKLLTMPTVALAPGSSAYPEGYHAGNVGGLSAVDADLSQENIKSGITIFGVGGLIGVNVIDVDFDSIFLHSGITSTIATSFSGPEGKPGSVAYDGTNLISCSSSAVYESIYIHSGVTETITTSFSSPAGNVTIGLTYAGTNLISSDFIDSSIYIHSGVTSTVTTSFSSPGGYSTDLAYDGSNLISISVQQRSIYLHSGITSTVTTSFSSPSTNPYGLTFHDSNLLSGDRDQRTIYIHSGITSTVTTSFSTVYTYGLAVYTG